MIDERVWEHITNSLTILEVQQKNVHTICHEMGIRPESILFDSFGITVGLLIQSLSLLIGDEQEWLAWFVCENKFGKAELVVGLLNKAKPIKTFDDLRCLLELRADD